ncbi:MAG TPA: hypothetical protein VES60_10595, partial [Nakamurella sp.]|nr:hypothetical protein [Nakamurella sp.]
MLLALAIGSENGRIGFGPDGAEVPDNRGGDGAGYRLQELADDGEPLGDPLTIGDPVDLLAFAGRGARWLWDATSQLYPGLLRAGVRLDRCHDITLTERILQARAGVFGEPSSASAVSARATGAPVPADREPATASAGRQASLWQPAQPMLFDTIDPAGAAALPVQDPLAVLRAAVADQQRRAGDDNALALLLAAESASGLAAVEMGHTGLPWSADVHRELLARALGPQPAAGRRPVRMAELATEIDEAFGFPVNPDSAVDLRAAFRRAGFDIETTR